MENIDPEIKFIKNPNANALNGLNAAQTKSKKLRAEIKRYEDDTWHRQILVYWSMIIVSMWLLFVMYMLYSNKCEYCGWTRLSDAAIITLMGTSTLNIIGLVLIVLRGYFPSLEKDAKPTSAEK